MCGIVGYVGPRDCVDVLLSGLKRLEYRGYDSAGIAVINGDRKTAVVRARGKIAQLEERLATERPVGHVGIGHTRWATHGAPTDRNAHPHKHGPITVVHNGIIENHHELRERLRGAGDAFDSDTDSEVVAHLVAEQFRTGHSPRDALRGALRELNGVYALCVTVDGVTDQLLCARRDAPLIIGIGAGETFVASDVACILPYTRHVMFLEDGDVAEVHADHLTVIDAEGRESERTVRELDSSIEEAEKGGWPHFMIKEIHEQPHAIADTLRGRLNAGSDELILDGFEQAEEWLLAARRIVLVGCGTAHHAALLGRFLIEGLARVPVDVDLASEFRYRDPLIGPGDVLIAVSQSGETADTLAAVREARSRGAHAIAICNVIESSIPRACEATFYTRAGPEISVCSTKAFTTQIVALLLLAIQLGRRRDVLTSTRVGALREALISIPAEMKRALQLEDEVAAVASKFSGAPNWLFLGRGLHHPIALEGALKLKEISYLHAEGYAAGEMKHGPIALIDSSVPVVAVVPRGPGHAKILSNLEEARSRGGRVIAIAHRDDAEVAAVAEHVFSVAEMDPWLHPLIAVVPLQLLAYHVAVARGADVDQPRNLAKSVTVE